MITGMVDYALHYQKNGFSVIPIDKKSKRPLTKFKNKSFTEHEIKLLWKENPDANIAVRTDNFFVIDIDVHGDIDGFESFNNWEGKDLIPETTQAITPTGGRHIFLKKPKGVSINQSVGFLDGVDIKANDNNYVLVAPSNTTNGSYVWDKENSLEGGKFAESPIELIELIGHTRKTVARDLSSKGNSGYSSQTAKLFEKIVFGLGDTGGRNNSLASLIGGLLLRGVDEEAVYKLALLANHYTPNQLPENEVDATYESMLRKELDRRSGS